MITVQEIINQLKKEISLREYELKHLWYEINEYETGENTDRLDGVLEGLKLALNLIEKD